MVLPHLDAAHNLARFLARDADAAEDIVQDAFLRAFRSFDDFRGGSPRAWILAIVRNCHHTWRAARRRDPGPWPEGAAGPAGDEIDGETPAEIASREDTPEAALLRRSEAEAVRAVLETLPEPFREVLVLRDLEDLSYREIAEVADLPIGTVMSRLARARTLFAARWRGAGPEDAA
nr:sigma-70 family RNA polymerase sigma factor [Labrys wisconsinensis]